MAPATPPSHSLAPRCGPCPEPAVMARLTNVRMRSMLLLVQFLSTCSGIEFKQPDELSCASVKEMNDTTIGTCSYDKKSGKYTLSVTLEFGHVQIPENSTGLKGELHMLGFNVPGSPGRSPGPTLRVRAGDTLKVLLKNNMPPEVISTASDTKNGYHDFSVVNMHTHGLHVSPLKPGDEVVDTRVQPNQTHQYIYHIPKDHMGGTHWYHPHWHGAVSIHTNFGAAGMIIVEDAVNQLPAEVAIVEDYIVATFNVDFDDITTITNGYVQNCICDLEGYNATCFDQTCEIDKGNGPTLWKSWKNYIESNLTDQFCPDNEFDYLCVQKNCKDVSEKDGTEVSDFGQKALSCAAQAEPFFRNPEGYAPPGSSLVLVNGQLEPTLEITANTWVRLRLGFMATLKIL